MEALTLNSPGFRREADGIVRFVSRVTHRGLNEISLEV